MLNATDRIVQLFTTCVIAALRLAGLRASFTQAKALTIHIVTTVGDRGPGSLCDAIGLAQPGDTIQISLTANSAIVLTSGELTVTVPITIDGSTPTNLTMSGNHASRVIGASAPLTSLKVSFIDNVADSSGGGVHAIGAVTIDGGVFQNNQSTNGLGGGALTNGLDVINTLFAHNTATVSGTALYLGSAGDVNLDYVTVGHPSLGLGAAIEIAWGNISIFDTLIANQAIGLRNDGGIVIQDYNLFDGNSVNSIGGVLGGGHNATGDPKFIDATRDNHHLSAGSVAIDKGADLGIPIDFDVDPRPMGNGFDIGFDEAMIRQVYLPLARK